MKQGISGKIGSFQVAAPDLEPGGVLLQIHQHALWPKNNLPLSDATIHSDEGVVGTPGACSCSGLVMDSAPDNRFITPHMRMLALGVSDSPPHSQMLKVPASQVYPVPEDVTLTQAAKAGPFLLYINAFRQADMPMGSVLAASGEGAEILKSLAQYLGYPWLEEKDGLAADAFFLLPGGRFNCEQLRKNGKLVKVGLPERFDVDSRQEIQCLQINSLGADWADDLVQKGLRKYPGEYIPNRVEDNLSFYFAHAAFFDSLPGIEVQSLKGELEPNIRKDQQPLTQALSPQEAVEKLLIGPVRLRISNALSIEQVRQLTSAADKNGHLLDVVFEEGVQLLGQYAGEVAGRRLPMTVLLTDQSSRDDLAQLLRLACIAQQWVGSLPVTANVARKHGLLTIGYQDGSVATLRLVPGSKAAFHGELHFEGKTLMVSRDEVKGYSLTGRVGDLSSNKKLINIADFLGTVVTEWEQA